MKGFAESLMYTVYKNMTIWIRNVWLFLRKWVYDNNILMFDTTYSSIIDLYRNDVFIFCFLMNLH